MTQPKPDVIRQTVLEVLEQFAMMLGDLDERIPLAASQAPHYRVSIRIQSQQAFGLSILAPRRFCDGLAANVLGIEGTIHEDTAQDALKELLNITAGKLTLDLYGNATAIPITIPHLEIVTPEEWMRATKNPSHFLFSVEGNPLIVVISNS